MRNRIAPGSVFRGYGFRFPILALTLLAAACSRRDMVDQPHLRPLQAAPLFAQGTSALAPPRHTVPYGSSGPHGPVPVTGELLQQGRERFEIFCAPCHGRTGAGDGLAVQRGFPAPPSLFSARVKADSDSRLYAVITHGYGRMYGYGYRLEREERIAVVAYLRALQSSREVPAAEALRLRSRSGSADSGSRGGI